jgi:AcrR family transcriptional regulator
MPDPRTDRDADAPGAGAPTRKRAGRRPGRSGTREAIVAAARDAFAGRGYDGVTLREVASHAGVDPGLIRHYFRDKKGLFTAAIELPWDGEVLIAAVMYGDPDEVGERVVRRFLEAWDPPESQQVLVTMIRSVAAHGRSEAAVRELVTNRMVAPVAQALDRPDPELRTTLAGALLVGLAMQRYVAHIEPFASMDAETAARIVGPTIQRFLVDPLPPH